MADRLHARLDVLEETAARVERVVNDVERKTIVVGDLGHAGLQAAVDRFEKRWEFGLERIGSDGDEFAARLTASVEAYRGVDEQISSLVAQLAQELDAWAGAAGAAGAGGVG